ncbi:helix-turn-helix domain-containing protein [Bizionia sediminis]|uniref:Helix-turn-helix domain-containing protein n=1 Tax=Bizionia sediminis TaxID=1737064 RepID=A0ABW5KUR0_9FLAO
MLDQLDSFLSLFVGFLGFLVVVFIITSYKWSAFFNLYLIIVFLVVSFRLVHIGLLGFYDLGSFNTYSFYMGPIILFAIPSVYLYFESLYSDRVHFNPKRTLHLIFPLSNLLLNSLQYNFSILNSCLIETIQIISIQVFIIGYCLASIYLSYNNLWAKRNDSSALSSVHEALMKKWAVFLLLVLVTLSIKLVYSIYTEMNENARIVGYKSSLVKSLLWFFVFVYILRSPELLYGYPKLKNRFQELEKKSQAVSPVWVDNIPEIKSAQDSKLNESIDTKIGSYLAEIERYINSNHPFRNSKYTIKDLSKDLNIPASHLSYVFKYHCEMSFVEFRNQNRIKDAVKYINTDFLENQTFDALADAVGFTSYNAFFVSFKKYTGLAPKDYIQSRDSHRFSEKGE